MLIHVCARTAGRPCRGGSAPLCRARRRHRTSSGVGRRLWRAIPTGQETVFLQHAILVPDRDVLAELRGAKCRGELAAEGVAIGTDVAEDDKALRGCAGRRRSRRSWRCSCVRRLLVTRSVSSSVGFDLLQDLKDARAALDGIVQLKRRCGVYFRTTRLRQRRPARCARCASSFAITASARCLCRGR